MILARFIPLDWTAREFIRSSFPTISTMKDCRAGMSNALHAPSTAARTNISRTLIDCVKVSAAMRSACIIMAVCVRITICRREYRSAMIPARGPRNKIGIWDANPAAPSRKADLVSR